YPRYFIILSISTEYTYVQLTFPTRRSSDLPAELENVVLRDAQMLDELPRRIRQPRRLLRPLRRRDIGNRGVEADVRVLPTEHLRSEEHTSELQSQSNLVCRLLLEKIKYKFT